MRTLLLILTCTLLRAQNADINMLKSINARDYPAWDKGMKGVSFSIYPVIPAAVLGTYIHARVIEDKELERNAYKSAISIALTTGITYGMKYAVNRTRPYTEYPDDIIKRDETGPYSFPSGHTSAAFATATALTLSYKKWYVAAPSFAYAGLVAYSRMRLGVHYPSDVLAGALIGAGTSLLTWQIDKAIRKN